MIQEKITDSLTIILVPFNNMSFMNCLVAMQTYQHGNVFYPQDPRVSASNSILIGSFFAQLTCVPKSPTCHPLWWRMDLSHV